MNSSTDNPRVLIVEVEPIVAMELTAILESRYDVVGTAGNVPDALNRIHRDELDIALLDVNLSGDTTEGVAALLAEQRVPFGIATAYPCAILPRQFHHRPCITKPYMAHEIRALARQLADEARDVRKPGPTRISSDWQ